MRNCWNCVKINRHKLPYSQWRNWADGRLAPLPAS